MARQDGPVANPFRGQEAVAPQETLHELDEALTFKQLLDSGKQSLDGIADGIHRSRRYVYQRLKLLTLSAEIQKAFRGHRISIAHAEELSRLTKTKQAKAFRLCFENGRLISVREFRRRIREM